MTGSEKAELEKLVHAYRTTGLDQAGLTRKAHLETKRTQEVSRLANLLAESRLTRNKTHFSTA